LPPCHGETCLPTPPPSGATGAPPVAPSKPSRRPPTPTLRGAGQVLQLRRTARTTSKGPNGQRQTKRTVEVVYPVCSKTMLQAQPHGVADARLHQRPAPPRGDAHAEPPLERRDATARERPNPRAPRPSRACQSGSTTRASTSDSKTESAHRAVEPERVSGPLQRPPPPAELDATTLNCAADGAGPDTADRSNPSCPRSCATRSGLRPPRTAFDGAHERVHNPKLVPPPNPPSGQNPRSEACGHTNPRNVNQVGYRGKHSSWRDCGLLHRSVAIQYFWHHWASGP
jgi:hypothetical protein